MIIFIEHGRLANQIFQYAALKTYAGNERIILLGFDALQKVFDNVDAKILVKTDSILLKIFRKLRVRDKLNRLLPKLRLFTTIYEDRTGKQIRISTKRGLINSGCRFEAGIYRITGAW